MADSMQFLEIALFCFNDLVVYFLQKFLFLLLCLKNQSAAISFTILDSKAIFVIKMLLVGHYLSSMFEGYIGEYSLFVLASF